MNIGDSIARRLIPDERLKAIVGKLGIELKAAADNLRMGLWGKPQRPEYNTETLMAAAKTNEVVYACLEVAGQALVDPRIYVERRNADGTWTEEEMHPAQLLIARPNPYYNETTFLRAAYTSMHVAGIFYVEVIRKTPNGPPVALYPLDPSKVSIVLQRDGAIDHYEWRDGSTRVDIPPENMMVWRKPDLAARWFGVSPLGVAMGAIAGDSAQTNFIQAFFDGGGQPAGVLTVKDRTLTADEADAIRQGWRAKFDGRRGGDRRDIAVLDNNAIYAKVGAGLDEIASEQLRGIAETRICMVFSTPPLIIYSYIGLQGATYSNLREAWDQFWDSKLTPWLKEYRVWLTDQLLSMFEDEALIRGNRVRFNWDMSQVAALSDDMDEISTRTQNEWKAGLITRAQALSRLKIESDEQIDGVYVDGTRRSTDVAVDAGPDIQMLALNGAQIASLIQIAQAVSMRTLAPDAAVTIIRYSFPSIPEEDARAMILAAASQEIVAPASPPADVAPPKQLRAPHSHKAEFTDAEIKAVKAIDDEREKIVKRFKPKIKQYVTQQMEQGADNVRAGKDPADGLDDGEHLAAIMKPVYNASIDAAYGKTNEQLAQFSVSVAFDQANPNVAKTVAGLLKKLKKDVPETTKEAIRARIAAGLDAGESIDKIADGIVADAPEIADARAEVIARTETASAYTEGALISYEESGVVKKVKWLSTLDNRTSEICDALNGQVVALGDKFDGEYDGPPAHPNCRSAILPVVE